MRKKTTTALLQLLLLQTAFFQVDLPEIVLCFGNDGHIAIEKTDADICGLESDYCSNINAVETIKSVHGDCTDLILDWHFSNADNVKKANYLRNTLLSGFLTQSVNKTKVMSFSNTFIGRSNRSKQIITSIKTTTLLI